MSGLFNGKQIKDGSITGAKLDVTYQRELTAGDNITIEGNIISSQIPVALSDEVLTYDTAGLKATLSVSVDGNQIQLLGKNDTNGDPIVIGEFNVLQSQIIDHVEVKDGHLFITFIIDDNGTPSTETVDIDLSTFIDIYQGSQYIDVTGDTISLDYDELSDTLINNGFVNDLSGLVAIEGPQTITGSKQFDANLITTHILPKADLAYSLGTNSARWAYAYASNVLVGSKTSVSDYTNTGVIIKDNGAIHSSNHIYTGAKISGNDGTTGSILSNDGRIYLTTTSSHIPAIYFYPENATDITGYIAHNANTLFTGSKFSINSSEIDTIDNSVLYVNGIARIGGGLSVGSNSDNGYAVRFAYSHASNIPSALLYKDSTHFSLMLTDPETPWGTYNSLRPLYINLTTGAVHSNTVWTIANVFKANDIFSNSNKSIYNDGIQGVNLNANGNIFSTSNSSPGIYFLRENSTTYTGFISNTGTNQLQMGGTLLPGSTSNYDLGASSKRWKTVFADEINLTGTITGLKIKDIYSRSGVSDANALFQASEGNLRYDVTSDTINTPKPGYAASIITMNWINSTWGSQIAISPAVGRGIYYRIKEGGTNEITPWVKLAEESDLDNYLPLTGGTLTGSLVTDNVYPSISETHSLGQSERRWTNIFTQHTNISNNLTFVPPVPRTYARGVIMQTVAGSDMYTLVNYYNQSTEQNYVSFGSTSAWDGPTRFFALPGGNFSIGSITDNGSKFQVTGSATFTGNVSATTFNNVSLTSSGNGQQFLSSDGTYKSTSEHATLTQAEFDALAVKDPNTYYCIIEE